MGVCPGFAAALNTPWAIAVPQLPLPCRCQDSTSPQSPKGTAEKAQKMQRPQSYPTVKLLQPPGRAGGIGSECEGSSTEQGQQSFGVSEPRGIYSSDIPDFAFQHPELLCPEKQPKDRGDIPVLGK